MKKIVVAPDSFKGSLTSAEVADAVERGIKDVFPQCNVVKADVRGRMVELEIVPMPFYKLER